ncbi:MAG: agmatine deiminase family protein [Alloprevotella sp.]|nr:agmatine deiminase family protein [Alloprevotella sp.]MBR1652406.1 agmatine deiminase family protein [Alloprevotella sp.]
MGLFALPPKPLRADLDLESLLKSDATETPLRRFRRTLAAEWFPQSGVQLTWPHEATDWAPYLAEITETYIRLAYEIAIREKLVIVHPRPEEVQNMLDRRLPQRATHNIIYYARATDDTWARDHAFLTVIGTGKPELLDFRFNGWGGKFSAEQDNAINRSLYEAGVVRGTYVDRNDVELEGGSVETDGMGTLLTTSACLRNPNRLRPQGMDIDLFLREAFGVENILWLDHGHLAGDDTDSHVDTLARLCPDNTIVYVKCDDTSDEHFEDLQRMERQLQGFVNADGKAFSLVPLPLPDAITEDGERLPATYANYLVLNRAILLPVYNQPEKDEQARRTLQAVFPKYDIVPIDSRILIRQHGSIHCATMQYPRGIL